MAEKAGSTALEPRSWTQMREATKREKEDDRARRGLLMSMLHADLKTLCQAKGLQVSGTKDVLTRRLVEQGSIITERQAQYATRLRAEAIARGVGHDLRPWDLIELADASRWLTETKRKCQEQRDKVD